MSNPRLIAILALTLLARPLFAEDANPFDRRGSISLSLGTGILYGQAQELVYAYSTGDELLSKLLWPLKPLVFSSYGLRFEAGGGEAWPYLELDFFSGLYMKTGTIENFDWLGEPGELTNYSAHDSYTERSFVADAQFGVVNSVTENVTLSTALGVEYMTFFWTARDGYLEYPPGSDPVRAWGTGISYEQTWLSLYLYLGVRYESSRWGSSLGVRVSPLSWTRGVDNHFMRDSYGAIPVNGLQFVDTMDGSFGVEPLGELSFVVNGSTALTLSASFKYQSPARGDTRIRAIATEDDVPDPALGAVKNGAGASISWLRIGVGFRTSFP